MAQCGGDGLRYKDKVTIVTGGAMGIGKGIVQVFVRHGSKVVIADINETVGKETEKAVNETGPGEAMFARCDLTKKDDVMSMVDAVISKYGRIDCLINNAGTCILGDTLTYDIENVKRLNDLNIVGPFIGAQVCLPHLRKVKGNMINIASVSGIIGGPQGGVIYNTTKVNRHGVCAACLNKGGLNGITKSLAAEEGPSGVRVNGVAPGCVDTELSKKVMKEDYTVKAANFFRQECNVMGRIGQPEEIGMACLFLAADATYSTGAILNCTGGSEIDYGVKAGPNHYSNF